jgi:hypothetical protein
MSKNKSAKTLRKEIAAKNAKQKKAAVICVCALAAVAAAVFLVNSAVRQSGAETYGSGGQSVTLYADGTFQTVLTQCGLPAAGIQKSGTFTKTPENGRVAVSFNVNGREEVGRIENGVLYIPSEWDDGHGHGNALPKR